MIEITLEQIKQDLETAAYVERLLPPVKPPKYRGWLFEIIYTPQEIAFMERKPIKIKPTQEQISLWNRVVFEWLDILKPNERVIVWKRSKHLPWKLLHRSTGISRQAMHRTYLIALAKIYGYVNKGKKAKKM